MIWKDSTHSYGLFSMLLHWVMAAMVIGQFVLGLYMTNLDYYHPWYNKAPDLHRSIGVLVGLLLLIRLPWRLVNTRPQAYGAAWERMLGKLTHRLFYLLLFAIVISGYLISTATGQAISVFDWFQIPASITTVENQEDKAGQVHEILVDLIILLAIIHSAAALKHHFIDKDPTLIRMLGMKSFDRTRSNDPQKENHL